MNALLLPTSTLVTGSSKPAVLCVLSGRVQRRQVEVGYNDGVRVQILRGLDGTEQVITDGKNSVREGQAVVVVK